MTKMEYCKKIVDEVSLLNLSSPSDSTVWNTIPLSEKAFKDLKKNAVALWKTHDNTHGYVSEKLGRIMFIDRVGDDAMVLFRMFDVEHKEKLLRKCKFRTVFEVCLRQYDETMGIIQKYVNKNIDSEDQKLEYTNIVDWLINKAKIG